MLVSIAENRLNRPDRCFFMNKINNWIDLSAVKNVSHVAASISMAKQEPHSMPLQPNARKTFSPHAARERETVRR